VSLVAALRRLVGREPAGAIRVHVIMKGRIGEGWYDVDERVALPEGATLATLLDVAESRGIALRTAIERSPHLRHTLMWNGDRCPVAENMSRAMRDGDEVYLLAPLAGG
jgi:molybdopterin converting factor small subunit